MTYKNEKKDHYTELTDRLIAELEKGVVPWRRPWDREKCSGPASPVNAATGHVYSGINVLILGMHEAAFVSGDPRFCTYKQAQEKGWQVRKDEKATPIVFYRPLEVDNDKYDPSKEDSPATRMIGMLRFFSVFHVSQMDGVPPHKRPTPEECPWLRPEAASIILKNSGAVITTGGDRAFYSPATDHINLPPDAAFHDQYAWASVAMHEGAHWTGHRSRLDRDLSSFRGSKGYAFEELIAETASVLIGSRLNLPSDIPNHASYIGHWLEIMREDKKAIFRAAAQAQRSADFLLSFHPDYALANKPDVEPETLRDVLPTPPAVVPEAMPA